MNNLNNFIYAGKEDNEVALSGWGEVARVLTVSEAKARSKKDELLAAGVIFYMRKGRPPKKVVMFYKSRLIRWTGIKGAKGEVI